jgi:hypothetical protein
MTSTDANLIFTLGSPAEVLLTITALIRGPRPDLRYF